MEKKFAKIPTHLWKNSCETLCWCMRSFEIIAIRRLPLFFFSANWIKSLIHTCGMENDGNSNSSYIYGDYFSWSEADILRVGSDKFSFAVICHCRSRYSRILSSGNYEKANVRTVTELFIWFQSLYRDPLSITQAAGLNLKIGIAWGSIKNFHSLLWRVWRSKSCISIMFTYSFGKFLEFQVQMTNSNWMSRPFSILILFSYNV